MNAHRLVLALVLVAFSAFAAAFAATPSSIRAEISPQSETRAFSSDRALLGRNQDRCHQTGHCCAPRHLSAAHLTAVLRLAPASPAAGKTAAGAAIDFITRPFGPASAIRAGNERLSSRRASLLHRLCRLLL